MNGDWSVYLVRRADGALYAGVALDVARRFAEHEAGGARAARSLRGRGPLELVRERVVGARGLALRVESRVKRLPKARKEELARSGRALARFVASCADHA
jgi:putative endonuclease